MLKSGSPVRVTSPRSRLPGVCRLSDALPSMHATTILMVRKGGRVVIGGDGQVSLGQTIVKGTDRYLRRLEAMMLVADKEVGLLLSGSGDVLEPEGGIMAIGSGGNFALA